jgi:hypothetical protein
MPQAEASVERQIVAKAALMAKFWLATFKLPSVAAPKAGAPRMLAGATPLAVPNVEAWAIEIIEDGNERAVLLSTVEGDPANPDKFVCRIGFANDAKSCAVWGDRGFPLSDAIIDLTRFGSGDLEKVTVRSPCFLSPRAVEYEPDLFSITNSSPGHKVSRPKPLASAIYSQTLKAPDVVFPGTHIQQKGFDWTPRRSKVEALTDTESTFKVAPSRYPKLIPLNDGKFKPVGFWKGEVDMPGWSPGPSANPNMLTDRTDAFGPAAFRFEDVEILGFRMNPEKFQLDSNGALAELAKLIEPLNFHLGTLEGISSETKSALSDFRYRPATRAVMIELLRYGKMKFLSTPPPLDSKDFQSQHELLARIQVGRVDDDTAQARDPADFVPAVFVDNAWSKALGRGAQGFDKRMANFCVLEGEEAKRLRPDGRRSKNDKDPEPLGSIREIHRSALSGNKSHRTKLLEIDCPYQTMHDWDAFTDIDPGLLLAPISAAPMMRWRPTDFLRPEYRRSFARSVMRAAYKQLGSIQSSPVGGPRVKKNLQGTLIAGTFSFRGALSFALPRGTIGLTFRKDPNPDASRNWNALCDLFGADRTISMPAWSWYRLRCSMDLKIDNGLSIGPDGFASQILRMRR